MNLSHLIYLSKLADKQEALLEGILSTAIRYNQRNNITGMLLYANGDILQVLEGDNDVIQALYARIARDTRHTELFLVIEEPIAARHFPQWSMGYRKIEKADLGQFSHYADIFKSTPRELVNRVRPGMAMDVMKSFSAWAMA